MAAPQKPFEIIDRTSEFSQEDIDANRCMGILSYISFLVLIPILTARDSKFARFHANQGLVLFIGEAIIGLIISILSALGKMPLIGWIFGIPQAILGIFTLGFTVLSVIGVIFAAQGRVKELPIIGSIKII